MKRSEANRIIKHAMKVMEEGKFPMPPFAYYTVEDWKNLGEDEEEIVQFLIEDGSIVDACWFDATPNNISEVASGKLPRLYGLDRFDSTHRNDRIPVLMEKARKVVDTIKELKEELSNLK